MAESDYLSPRNMGVIQSEISAVEDELARQWRYQEFEEFMVEAEKLGKVGEAAILLSQTHGDTASAQVTLSRTP